MLSPEGIPVGIRFIAQVFLHDRQHLGPVLPQGGRGDVLEIVQVGMIVVHIRYGREIEPRQTVLHYGEIREIRHKPIYHIGQGICALAGGVAAVQLQQPVVPL